MFNINRALKLFNWHTVEVLATIIIPTIIIVLTVKKQTEEAKEEVERLCKEFQELAELVIQVAKKEDYIIYGTLIPKYYKEAPTENNQKVKRFLLHLADQKVKNNSSFNQSSPQTRKSDHKHSKHNQSHKIKIG